MTVSDELSLALGHIQDHRLQFNLCQNRALVFPGQPVYSSLHQHSKWHPVSCSFQGCLKSWSPDWWSIGFFWLCCAGLESIRSRGESSEHHMFTTTFRAHVNNMTGTWSLGPRIRCKSSHVQHWANLRRNHKLKRRFSHHKVACQGKEKTFGLTKDN